jgi:hypothetical protein
MTPTDDGVVRESVLVTSTVGATYARSADPCLPSSCRRKKKRTNAATKDVLEEIAVRYSLNHGLHQAVALDGHVAFRVLVALFQFFDEDAQRRRLATALLYLLHQLLVLFIQFLSGQTCSIKGTS